MKFDLMAAGLPLRKMQQLAIDAAAAGIDAEIVPGIMPVTNFASVVRMSKMCGTDVPAWMARLFDGLEDHPASRQLIAATLAIFFVWTYPANQATANWTVPTPNWQALRTQWEYAHAVNAVLTFLALCLLTWSAVTARD